jgi:hypothetical protein
MKIITKITIAIVISSGLLAQSQNTINFKVNPNNHKNFYSYDRNSNTSLSIEYKFENGFLKSDSMKQYWGGDVWIDWYKTDFIYNSSNNIKEKIIRVWNQNWFNHKKILYKYDTNQNLILTTVQNWDETLLWFSVQRRHYIYDPSNKLVEWYFQYWNGSNWINSTKNTLSYDEIGNLVEDLFQSWDGSNWINEMLLSYLYDENNNLIQRLEQSWYNSNWSNGSRYLYYYNLSGRLIEWKWQYYYSNNWKDIGRELFYYDANNRLESKLKQRWNDLFWIADEMEMYFYDAFNNLIELLQLNWDPLIGWINDWLYNYAYDEDGNLVEEIYQLWLNLEWNNASRFLYSYIPTTGIEEFEQPIHSYLLYQNYPNPFNPSTTIKFTISDLPTDRQGLRFTTLKVYDVLGNEIVTLVNKELPAGEYEVEFQSAIGSGQLTSGIYFYQLKAGNFVETKKMILLK